MTTPAIGLTITTAGLLRFTQAQEGDSVDLTVSTVAFGGQPFVVAPTLTAVPGEIKRIATISGETLDDTIVHLTVRDDTADTYQVYGLGLYLADGTLFAVYGQATPFLQKSTLASVFLALDLKFPAIDVTNVVFGDTNFLDPPATETTKGVAKIATQALVDAGANDETIVSPLKLAVRLSAALANLLAGLFASSAETIAGVISNKAVQPAGLLAALDNRLGAGAPTAFVKTLLASVSALTARATLGLGNVATLNVGSGNGIDADKLDGFEGAAYLRIVDSGTTADGSWRKFSDGTIEQWGVLAIPSNADSTNTVAANYPVAFPAGVTPRLSAQAQGPGRDDWNPITTLMRHTGAGTYSINIDTTQSSKPFTQAVNVAWAATGK